MESQCFDHSYFCCNYCVIVVVVVVDVDYDVVAVVTTAPVVDVQLMSQLKPGSGKVLIQVREVSGGQERVKNE